VGERERERERERARARESGSARERERERAGARESGSAGERERGSARDRERERKSESERDGREERERVSQVWKHVVEGRCTVVFQNSRSLTHLSYTPYACRCGRVAFTTRFNRCIASAA
jgi:hypothetical protein